MGLYGFSTLHGFQSQTRYEIILEKKPQLRRRKQAYKAPPPPEDHTVSRPQTPQVIGTPALPPVPQENTTHNGLEYTLRIMCNRVARAERVCFPHLFLQLLADAFAEYEVCETGYEKNAGKSTKGKAIKSVY